jgi:DNA repair protein RadC
MLRILTKIGISNPIYKLGADMGINDWPEGERPREKLIQRGAAALSDAELLAIFLRTGVVGKSAVDLARDLLYRFGTLTAMFAASQKDFCNIHGMGQAKFVQMQAVLEMSRRALGEEMRCGDALNSPRAVRDYLQLLLRGREQEVFMVIFLDAQHRVLAAEELFHGTLTQTSVYPREVVKRTLFHNAAAVILAHNHPSGVAEPSHSDRLLTDALKQALALVDVRVLDHFIVAGNGCLSFAERGMV